MTSPLKSSDMVLMSIDHSLFWLHQLKNLVARQGLFIRAKVKIVSRLKREVPRPTFAYSRGLRYNQVSYYNVTYLDFHTYLEFLTALILALNLRVGLLYWDKCSY